MNEEIQTLKKQLDEARLHVDNLMMVIDVLRKGYEDQRLAPMPIITTTVLKNAAVWLESVGGPLK